MRVYLKLLAYSWIRLFCIGARRKRWGSRSSYIWHNTTWGCRAVINDDDSMAPSIEARALIINDWPLGDQHVFASLGQTDYLSLEAPRLLYKTESESARKALVRATLQDQVRPRFLLLFSIAFFIRSSPSLTDAFVVISSFPPSSLYFSTPFASVSESRLSTSQPLSSV
mgnify:CR=1 FL=1